MRNFVVTCIGMLLGLLVASENCRAAVFQFDGGAADGGQFLTPGNWTDNAGDASIGPPNDSTDQGIINNSSVVTYGTAAATTVGSLIVGADFPTTGSTLGTKGTLNMTAGSLTVDGGGSSFTISRACCGGDGSAVNLSGNAALTILGTDPQVGQRDQGSLTLHGTSSVTSPNGYWRLGNYGHNEDIFDPVGGLQGDGLLSVADNSTFSAMVIFIGDNSAVGELRVSDHGSVVLADNLVPRPSGFQALGSAKIQMNGATATLSAHNLESASEVGEIPTLYEFNADPALGVSHLTLQDAINITNNSLTVNLNGFPLALGSSLLLFDGDHTGVGGAPVGDRIFGTFSNVSVLGAANPLNYHVVYDQPHGDILLTRVPEPGTALLFSLGLIVAIGAKRRASR